MDLTGFGWIWINFQRIWMDLDGFGLVFEKKMVIFPWILIKEDTIKNPLYLEPPAFRTPDTYMNCLAWS